MMMQDMGDAPGRTKRAAGGKSALATGGETGLARGGKTGLAIGGAPKSKEKAKVNMYNAVGSPEADHAEDETPAFSRGGKHKMHRKSGGHAMGGMMEERHDRMPRKAGGRMMGGSMDIKPEMHPGRAMGGNMSTADDTHRMRKAGGHMNRARGGGTPYSSGANLTPPGDDMDGLGHEGAGAA